MTGDFYAPGPGAVCIALTAHEHAQLAAVAYASGVTTTYAATVLLREALRRETEAMR